MLTISGKLLDFVLVLSSALHVQLGVKVADKVGELVSVLVDSVVVGDVGINPGVDVLGDLR